jgi:hypothetical protein
LKAQNFLLVIEETWANAVVKHCKERSYPSKDMYTGAIPETAIPWNHRLSDFMTISLSFESPKFSFGD